MEQPPVNVLADDDDEVKIDLTVPGEVVAASTAADGAPDDTHSSSSSSTSHLHAGDRLAAGTDAHECLLGSESSDTASGKVQGKGGGETSSPGGKEEEVVTQEDDTICSKCGFYKDDGYGGFSNFGTSLYCQCSSVTSDTKKKVEKGDTEE